MESLVIWGHAFRFCLFCKKEVMFLRLKEGGELVCPNRAQHGVHKANDLGYPLGTEETYAYVDY